MCGISCQDEVLLGWKSKRGRGRRGSSPNPLRTSLDRPGYTAFPGTAESSCNAAAKRGRSPRDADAGRGRHGPGKQFHATRLRSRVQRGWKKIPLGRPRSRQELSQTCHQIAEEAAEGFPKGRRGKEKRLAPRNIASPFVWSE